MDFFEVLVFTQAKCFRLSVNMKKKIIFLSNPYLSHIVESLWLLHLMTILLTFMMSINSLKKGLILLSKPMKKHQWRQIWIYSNLKKAKRGKWRKILMKSNKAILKILKAKTLNKMILNRWRKSRKKSKRKTKKCQ